MRVLENYERNLKVGAKKRQRLNAVNSEGLVLYNSAFDGLCKMYCMRNLSGALAHDSFLEEAKPELVKTLRLELVNGVIKFNLMLESTYNLPNTEIFENRAFKTSAQCLSLGENIEEVLSEAFLKLLLEVEEYSGKGSGYVLNKVDSIVLNTFKFTPLGGGSYIPLPQEIQNRHAVINVVNNDNMCFKYAILSRFVKSNNPQRLTREYHEISDKFNFSGLTFPVPLSDIKIFEENNPGVSVNVYGLQTGVNTYKNKSKNSNTIQREIDLVIPYKVCNNELETHFDLLLIEEEESGNRHYCLISHFSRLVRSQVSRHCATMVFCKRCLKGYSGQNASSKLLDHRKFCNSQQLALPVLPMPNTIMKFENWGNTQRHPVSIFADFECILKNMNDCQPIDHITTDSNTIDSNTTNPSSADVNTTDPNIGDPSTTEPNTTEPDTSDPNETKPKAPKTTKTHKHIPMSFCFYVKASDDVPVDLLDKFGIPKLPVLYRGDSNCSEESVAKRFVEEIVMVGRKIEDMLKTNVPINITDSDESNHYRVLDKGDCPVCTQRFTVSNHAVLHHNHLNGSYIQTVCNNCNLKLKTPSFVPCYFHNMSHYDSHFIVKQFGYDTKSIHVIPNSEEKYISFSKHISNRFCIKFIDTFRFMATSLEKLAKNLSSDVTRFREVRKIFNLTDIYLVTRKGVFPYEYIDCWEKLEETKLPPIKKFYNSLKEEDISTEDYQHAHNVWNHFGFKNLGEYSDWYLKVDVLLLTDIFENFRDLCMETYGLDVCYYYTAPGMSFDCMLKHTRVEIELLHDYDQLMMFQRGIRGGLTQAVRRYSKANNHTIPDYDKSQPDSWIIYLDANNL